MTELDHDVFGSKRSKDMNVIDSNKIEHDVVRKPVPTFRHHALEAAISEVFGIPDGAKAFRAKAWQIDEIR